LHGVNGQAEGLPLARASLRRAQEAGNARRDGALSSADQKTEPAKAGGFRFSGVSPNLKNKLAGRLPLSDRPFAFLVTPKLLFAQEK
jgi:hypothetical protein